MLKNYYDLLSSGEIKLFNWGEFRWFEGFIAINFLWSRNPENWLKELAEICTSEIGKSGINHRLRKLSEIAEELREGKEE